jgi:hypothetical protein
MTTATSHSSTQQARRNCRRHDGSPLARPADFQFRADQAIDGAALNSPETDAEGNARALSLLACAVRLRSGDAFFTFATQPRRAR